MMLIRRISFQVHKLRLRLLLPQLSKAVGAVTKMTIKLHKIKVPAIILTIIILPLLAGNFPLMT
jgi:hypothetical protein